MKLAITATQPSLDSALDPRFGRCAYFLLVDPQDMSLEAIENNSAELGGGAGIQSAQLMAQKGVTAVLTGNCGPNAHQTLTAAGIEVVIGLKGTISEVIAQYQAGSYTAAAAPNVASHAGLRTNS